MLSLLVVSILFLNCLYLQFILEVNGNSSTSSASIDAHHSLSSLSSSHLTLLTMFTFDDYLANEWNVLKGIQSIRHYGDGISHSRLVVIILYNSRDEIKRRTEKYNLLTIQLRAHGSEYYLLKSPYEEVGNSSSSEPNIEIILRSMLLFGLSDDGGHVFYFDHSTFFLSNPLANTSIGISCSSSAVIHNQSLFEDELYELIFKLGLSLTEYTNIVRRNALSTACSSDMLLVPSFLLKFLWSSVSKSMASASIEAADHSESSNSVILNLAISQLSIQTYVFPKSVYDISSEASSSVAAVLLDSSESDFLFYINKTSGGCYVGAVGSVSQTLVDLIIARARAAPDSCNSMAGVPSRPWVDVVEIGKVDFYLTAPPWSSGFSLCSDPCVFDSSTPVLGVPLDHRLGQNKGSQGVQLLYIGTADLSAIYFDLRESNDITLERASIFSVGFGIGNGNKPFVENLQSVLSTALGVLKRFLDQGDSRTRPCVFHIEVSTAFYSYSSSEDNNVHRVDAWDQYNKLLSLLFAAEDVVEPILNQLLELDTLFSRLGYIILSSDQRFRVYGVSGHCPREKTDRLYPFLHEGVFEFIRAFRMAAVEREETHDFNGPVVSSSVDMSMNYIRSSGNTMKCGEHSNEFRVFDDTLAPEVLALIVDRLTLLPKNSIGAESYFIPFDKISRANPRSAIEKVILDDLAPLVLGDIDAAVADGYIGAEWWTQSRGSRDPKEFHMDTAITWCRDNGWPENLLTACHFYPSVGSILYLSDLGGPTVVFNQSTGEKGLNPLLPTEILLSYPKENRLLLFKGNRFHGVMKDDSVMDTQRHTLLVNYWRNKTAGEDRTPIVSADNDMIQRLRQLYVSALRPTPKNVPIGQLYLQRDFRFDLRTWQSQVVPEAYRQVIMGMGDGNQGVYLIRIPRSSLEDELSGNGHYQNWHMWPADDSNGFFTVLKLPEGNWREEMPGGDPFGDGAPLC